MERSNSSRRSIPKMKSRMASTKRFPVFSISYRNIALATHIARTGAERVEVELAHQSITEKLASERIYGLLR